ncbi:MAG: riboflavin kinase, partial [Alistipes sp.]|nr:riboflavin kinase [Candidatus Minthomonas equi]
TIACLSFLLARRHRPHSGAFMVPAGRFLAVVLIVLFWVCYVPDVLDGGNSLWLFTAAVYAIALVFWFAGRKRAGRRLHGIVVHGKGRGHLHSMPTANLKPFRGQSLPEFGVWSVKVFYAGKYYRGVSNVGFRPSDDDSPVPSVETLIFDFDEDIYGKKITLEFGKFIRPTRKFANLDELRTQIELDIKSCFDD